MGFIVDGRVSGKLPDQVAFAVNYPGYPSSAQRAIETLGGEEALMKARSSEANFLELKFRPEDPHAHPTFGELCHSSDLVLRISRKAKRGASKGHEEEISTSSVVRSPEDSMASESTEDIQAEIVAKVEHSYSFEGMADYQYVIAIHADDNRGHKRKGHRQESGSLLDMEQGEPMMLVPPLFSVKDLPEDIFLRPPGGKRPKPVLHAAECSPEVVVPYSLDFKVKKVPSSTAWRQQLDKNSDAYEWTEAIMRLFEERPIWAKNTLNDRLMEQEIFLTDVNLRSLLLRISYYFGCGPFRNLWIKNGYDPRKDPESRKYQGLDFRVPIVLREKGRLPRVSPSWKDLCSFKAVPQKKFTIFQIYDLQDDAIQTELSKPPERATCGEATGWYRLSTMQKIRLMVRIRFLALYPGAIARSLENAERKNLNRPRSVVEREEGRTKDALDVPDTLDSLEVRDGNGGSSLQPLQLEFSATGVSPSSAVYAGIEYVDGTGDDEPAVKVTEEEEEEEDEDDEDELEDDEDEELEDVDGQSENNVAKLHPSMQAYINPADNIPKSYLQALLGKFTFESDGVKHPGQDSFDAQEYDEEYTIFEQDEDDEDN